jgi:hypothetical protein
MAVAPQPVVTIAANSRDEIKRDIRRLGRAGGEQKGAGQLP